MSERVLPTEPGWWYANVYGIEQIVLITQDMGVSAVGLNRFCIEDSALEWLEPVAPLGTTARLAAAEAELTALKERIAEATAGKVTSWRKSTAFRY